jgi:CRP/FNR family transcriptional regulator
VLHHAPYEPIYACDAPFEGVFLIVDGMVKGIVDVGGNKVISTLSLPGDMLGADSFQKGHYVTTSIATSAVETLWIPREAFYQLRRVSPTFRRQVDDAVAQGLAERILRNTIQTTASAEVRVAYFLLKIFSRVQSIGELKASADLGLSRAEIGGYLGLAEATICSQLEVFCVAGFIAMAGQKVEMRDREALRRICGPIVVRF